MEEMSEIRTPARDDAIVQAAVLRHLLTLHPIQLTLGELVREITGDASDFAPKDAVERAARELAAAGLVNRSGDIILPSRAALRFDELLS
jgi:hypothetical protein